MANGERLRNTVGRINAIMCEASSNCLRPIIPYPTLYGTFFMHIKMFLYGMKFVTLFRAIWCFLVCIINHNMHHNDLHAMCMLHMLECNHD